MRIQGSTCAGHEGPGRSCVISPSLLWVGALAAPSISLGQQGTCCPPIQPCGQGCSLSTCLPLQTHWHRVMMMKTVMGTVPTEIATRSPSTGTEVSAAPGRTGSWGRSRSAGHRCLLPAGERLGAAPATPVLTLGPLPLHVPCPPSTVLDSPTPDGQEAVRGPRGEHGEVSLPGLRQPQPQHPLVQEWARVPGGAPHRGHPGKGQGPPLQPLVPRASSLVTPRVFAILLCSSGTSTGAW